MSNKKKFRKQMSNLSKIYASITIFIHVRKYFFWYLGSFNFQSSDKFPELQFSISYNVKLTKWIEQAINIRFWEAKFIKVP